MVDHTDGQGDMSSYTLGPSVIDVDRDDDGLIEIYYLDNLDAIRHQLDGSGYKASGSATRITTGCPDTGCNGYELVGDLDFTTTQSYVSGIVNDDWVLSDDDFTDTTKLGWLPIGSVSNFNCRNSSSRCFNSIFEGNGYRISNLYINRDGDLNGVGLFAGNLGTIRNVGLSEIRVEGRRAVGGLVGSNGSRLMNVYVDGDSSVMATGNRAGPLVGTNQSSGLIINSYAHGTVSLTSDGGFFAGGLCGYSEGRIINSYADTDVSGNNGDLGGLVGEVERPGSVINSYAAGSVFDTSPNLEDVGGLIGDVDNIPTRVSNSYSIAEVRNTRGGGLIGVIDESGQPGQSVRDRVRDSYWDTETSGRSTSRGGTRRTTEQLQMPTSATGIYANWSSDDWDFGDASSYPALRYAGGDDNNNPACDVDPDTSLPPCGAVLSGQTIRDRGLSILFFVVNGVQLDNARVFQDQSFSPLVFDYDITTPGRRTEIALRPYAINDTATISVLRASDNTSYFDGKHSGDLSAPIVLEAGTAEVLQLRVDGLTYNFNLIRASQSPVEIVSFGTTPSIATVNEGDDIRFQAVFRNGSGDYQYSLQQGGTVLAQGQDTTAIIDVTVPDTFVAAERTTQSIVYTITVDDGFDTTSTALMLTVSREDNGTPQLELDVSPTELRITSAVADPDGVGTFSYQWQSRDKGDSNWTDVSGNNPYMVSGTTASTVRYRAIVNHTDGQRYRSTYRIGPFPIDVDGDDDGLIDVYYLEDLDAIRNQPDGSGYGLAAVDSKITSGCLANTCSGYELLRDLDFTTTQSYVDVMSNRDEWTVDHPAVATDTGWLPIATVDAPFTSLFNGNNNNISNLQINRDTVDDASIGLFAALSSSARLENVGILDVAIGGRGSVGSLVGQNEGVIANSYAQGKVEGAQHRVGGLVAFNDATGVIINSYANVMTTSTAVLSAGGLVGNNTGTIRNSYAAGDVGGVCDVGGLVAENGSGGEIVNSYAAGAVSRSGSCSDAVTRTRAGGLVADNAGLIRNSYVRGSISAGGGTAGGLVAVGASGTIESSYWDSTVNSGIAGDSMARTTADLRTPTNDNAAMGIYADWNSDDWDFGTAMQYPLLRYTSPTDIAIAAVCDDDFNTAPPPCGSVLLAQAQSGLSNLLFFVRDNAIAPDPPFSLSVLSYTVNVENTNTIELLPYGINPLGESITITRVGDTENTDYFRGRLRGEQSLPIPLPGGVSTLEIVVGTDSDDMSSVTYSTTVTNTVNRVVVEEIIAPDRVSEGDAINLSATVMGGALAGYVYQWTSDPAAFLAGQDRTTATLSFNVPTDFVSRDDDSQDVKITLAVNDGFTNSSATQTVTVAKADNGQPSFTETVTVSSISIDIVPGSDADGDGTIDRYTWQRRSAGDSEWTTIAGQTSAMFSIPPEDNGDTLYRVQVMSTDAQGNGFTSLLGPYRNRTDIDDDDDGLIDIYYLEDLDAVRHQTDGSGYGTTDITRGCRLVGGSETCMGYELRRDLDFTTTQSYVDATTNRAAWTVDNFAIAGDSGWDPIGSVANNNCSDASSDCFAGVFEGNGFSISNLQINRDNTNEIGMFAGNSNTGTIRNLGLREIEVEGNVRTGGLVGRNEGNLINAHVIESRVQGGNNAGLLAGVNGSSGLIINSYVRGTVVGSRWVAGICGINTGRIINSYAEVIASGVREVGGLVAENQGTIRNSYAMGSVRITSTDTNNRRSVGGLLAVLWTGTNPSVTNTYSTVAVTAVLSANNIGGLIGSRHSSNPPITASYWDTDTSERTASPGGGIAQTTSELQMPTAPGTAPTDVYYQWSTDDWDFGTSRTYAALRYAIGDDSDNPGCDVDPDTPLPLCRSLLPGQRAVPVGENTTPTIKTNASLSISLDEDADTTLNVVINDEDDDVLRVSIVSSNEAIATAMVSGAGGTRVLEISGVGVGDATITVTVDDGRGETNSTASLVFNVSVSADPRPMITLAPATDQSLPLGSMPDIMVSVADGNYGEGETVTLAARSSDPTIVSVMPPTVTGIMDNTAETFRLNAMRGGMATITFTAEDSNGLSDSADLSVRVNAPPTLSGIPEQTVRLLEGMNTSIVVTPDDANTDDMPANFVVRATSDTPGVAGVLVGGSGATRLLAISATGAGRAVIMVTVDDGRGLANSVFSAQFEVQVQMQMQANTTPTITLAPSTDQSLPLGNMPDIMVSVADSDYGDGDSVTLTARSSSRTIVSVMPPTVPDIEDNTTRTFTLNALQGGVATITFTATDSRGSSRSADLSVRVNAPPTLSGIPEQPVRLLEGMNTSIDVTPDDADADDTLDLRIATDDSTIASATIIATTGAVRTLEIVGVGVGNTTLTVTVNDGRGVANSVVSEQFTVQVGGSIAPILEIVAAPEQPIQLGSTAQVVVGVSDSNFDLGDRITLTAMSSSRTIVSVMPGQIDDIRSDTRATLTLMANRAGVAEIEVTATDRADLSSSGTLEVVVNTPPTPSARVPTRAIIATVGVSFERDIGEFFSDADGDTLTYGIAIEPTSGLIDGFSTTNGTWTFTATDADVSRNTAGSTVTVSADDGRGGRVQASFTLLIDAPPTGTVRIAPDSDDRWRLRTISTLADANGIETTSYRWFINDTLIDGATENDYRIPDDRPSRTAGTRYRLEATVVDNIGQSVTTRSNVYMVANIAPMITLVNVAPSPVSEGGTVSMTAEASDENFDSLSYRWRVSSINATEADVSGATALLTLRDYFVTDANAATATAIFVVSVSDGMIETTGMFSVEVNKEDNGVVSVNNLTRSPTTETRLIFTGIDKTTETDGGVRGSATYHWQQCLGSLGDDCSIDVGVGSGWRDIVGQTGTLGSSDIFYEVPSTLSALSNPNHRVRSGDRFRVRIAYTDLQAYTRSVYSSNLGARLGQNTTPTIMSNAARDLRLLEGGRITVPVSVGDTDGGVLNVKALPADDMIASAMISGDGITRTLTIVGERAGDTMITATVDDGTGEANATASLVFDVTVEKNTVPTLLLASSSALTLPTDTTTDTIVSVADDNFDLGDVVTLTAVSSTPSVVSVMPMQVDITTDTSVRFVLNAEQGGVSMITFVATDRAGSDTRAELSVRVNTTPTLSGIPEQPIRLLGGVNRELVLTIADADADDSPDIRIDSSDSMIASATIIATTGAMRTLEISGERAGNTTITVTVNDGRGVANSQVSRQFAVQVEASEAPMIDIISAPRQVIEPGGTADIVVRVSDANFDFGDRVALTAMSSSRTIVSVMPEQIDDIEAERRETLTLRANRAGVAEIILTATDSEGLRSSETVMVNVNTPPQVVSERVPTRAIIATIGVRFELQTADFFSDADDDVLTYNIAIVPPSDLTDGFSTTNGTWTFTATDTDASQNMTGSIVTVSADDGRDGRVQATFTLLIDAPPTGDVRIEPDSDDRWLLRTISTIADANGIATTSSRWFINDTSIDGATENEYRIPDDRASRAAGTRYRLEATVVDNIGQSVSTRSNVYTVADESPVIVSITDPQTINETTATQNINISVTASDPNYDDLTYSWSADPETLNNATSPTATLVVPPDFVAAASSDTTVNIEVMVSDGTATMTSMTSVVVNKVNNGAITITIDASIEVGSEATTLTAMRLTDDPDGNPSDDDVRYQWQICSAEGNWDNITDATTRSYLITSDSGGNSFRVQARYTDGQGYMEVVNSPAQCTPLTSGIRIRAKVFLEGPLQ